MVTPERKGRHWVPLLLMAVLVLCCTALFYAIPLQREEPAISADMPWFSVQEGILYFDEAKYTGSSQLTVPEKVNNIPVIAIGDGCFEDCTTLTAILLPNTLEAIGEEAFRGCTSLRGMEIPASVAFVGKGAFSGCSVLEAVCFSNNMRHIGADALAGCTGLRYIYFLGNFQEWTGLYPDFIGPTVIISCKDGKFFQDGSPS